MSVYHSQRKFATYCLSCKACFTESTLNIYRVERLYCSKAKEILDLDGLMQNSFKRPRYQFSEGNELFLFLNNTIVSICKLQGHRSYSGAKIKLDEISGNYKTIPYFPQQ